LLAFYLYAVVTGWLLRDIHIQRLILLFGGESYTYGALVDCCCVSIPPWFVAWASTHTHISGCLLVVPLSVVLTGWLLTDTHIRRMMFVGVSFLRCCHWLVVERYTYTAVDTLVWWRIIYIWGIG